MAFKLRGYEPGPIDINRITVLTKFAKYPELSVMDFIDKQLFDDLSESGPRCEKLEKVIRDLQSEGYIRKIDRDSDTWTITTAGNKEWSEMRRKF